MCEESLAAFDDLFFSVGASVAEHDDLEENAVKIALFAVGEMPTHAARQLRNGAWTSKLGKFIDIAHELRDIEGPEYGRVVRIYAVPTSPDLPV